MIKSDEFLKEMVLISFEVNPISENDVEEIINLYKLCYGESYPYKDFYEPYWIKKGIYDDSIIWLAVKDDKSVLGSGALMLEAGDHTDLMGEFGRFVVNPKKHQRGTGKTLFIKLLEEAKKRLEFCFGEARTVHIGSQTILDRFGFTPLGFEPLKYLVSTRESMVLYGNLFGNAIPLRNNNPVIIPAVEALAKQVTGSMGLKSSFKIDNFIGRYPVGTGLRLERLDDSALPRLLRIKMGQKTEPEVFGSLHLNYGFFKITAQNAYYMVARDADEIVGSIAFTEDPVDSKVKIFELIAKDDFVKGFLIEKFDRFALKYLQSDYIEVDLSSYSPRIQKTFSELGYHPITYCPAMRFHEVERLDTVRFAKINIDYDLGKFVLTDPSQKVFDIVNERFQAQV